MVNNAAKLGGGFGSYFNLKGGFKGASSRENLEMSNLTSSPREQKNETTKTTTTTTTTTMNSKTRRPTRTWTELFHLLAERLLAPIDGVNLGFFRIGLACALYMQAMKWSRVMNAFLKSGTLLTYPMFEWVPPPSPRLGDLEIWGLHLCPLFIGLGIFTRLFMTLEFLCFTHIYVVGPVVHVTHTQHTHTAPHIWSCLLLLRPSESSPGLAPPPSFSKPCDTTVLTIRNPRVVGRQFKPRTLTPPSAAQTNTHD